MEMKATHHEAPSCPQTEAEADLTAVPSERKAVGDEDADANEPALKVAKLDTTISHGSADTRVNLSKLCHGCTELGNDLYEKRLEEEVNIPILRYPRDGGCVLCTILHEKATAMERHYGLEPARLFELRALPLYKHGAARPLRLSPTGFDRPNTSQRGTRDLRFRFFTPEGYDWQASLLRPVEVDFNKIRTWLNFCGNHHKTLCKTVTAEPWEGQYGLMVMDCVEECMVLLPRGQSPYVTLSYVWGTSLPACQLKLGSHINVTTLERTIRDAITVLLKLGLRYLWVDRYCIPQQDLREKHLQIQHMGDIYANSFLTVIACAGDDAEAGLPGVGLTPRSNNLSVLTQTWSLQSGILNAHEEIHESAWHTRGWTFQEGLLAKRRLVFSSSNVYFQCAAMHLEENKKDDLASMHIKNLEQFPDTSFNKSIFSRYGIGKRDQDVVLHISRYLNRQFSHDSDILDAFLGILSTFEKSKAIVGHVGGLPIFSPGLWGNTETFSQLDMFAYSLGWEISVWQPKGAIFRRPDYPSSTWTGWRRTGSEIGLSFQYIESKSPTVMIQLKSETIPGLPAFLNPNSKIDHTSTCPRQLEIRAWTAKLSLQDENKMPRLALAGDLYNGQKKPILCRELATLAMEHFRSLGCSELIFDDMLLVPVLQAGQGSLYTLILCYESKAKGYTRLPYTLHINGTMLNRGHGHMLLSPENNQEGAMTFERRTIKLV